MVTNIKHDTFSEEQYSRSNIAISVDQTFGWSEAHGRRVLYRKFECVFNRFGYISLDFFTCAQNEEPITAALGFTGFPISAANQQLIEVRSNFSKDCFRSSPLYLT